MPMGACGADGTAEGVCLVNTLQPGTSLVASGYCLYSSSCIFVLTIGAGTHGVRSRLAARRLLHLPACLSACLSCRMARLHACEEVPCRACLPCRWP